MNLLIALQVGGAIALLDIVWVFYTRGIAHHRYAQAGISAGLIPIFSGLATIEIVQEPLYLIPAAIGGAVATVGAMWWDAK